MTNQEMIARLNSIKNMSENDGWLRELSAEILKRMQILGSLETEIGKIQDNAELIYGDLGFLLHTIRKANNGSREGGE